MTDDLVQDWYLDYQQETSEWRNELLSEQREDVQRYNDEL